MIHLLWASLAIPIVIHLVHRRKAKRVPFSTLRFLRMVDERVARRQRLKELLLLASRLLLLAALIGALYRPMIRSVTFKGADVPTTVAIVLDNTYSMQTTAGGILRFVRARQAALEVLKGLRRGDAASLVLTDRSMRAETEAAGDPAALREELETLECGYGTAQVADALRRASAVLEGSSNPRKELYVISDFQRLTWAPGPQGFETQFPSDCPVFFVDAGGEAGVNLAVEQVEFGLNVQVAGTASQIYCTVSNPSRRNAESRLALYVGGEKVAEREISLAAGARRTEAFSHVFGRPGEASGAVRVESDVLDADNARYFTASVLKELPVLVVNGDPSAVPYRGETFYLELALDTPAAGGQDISPIAVKTVAPHEAAVERWRDYACVIMANVPRLDELLADRLRSYVEGGGGLIIFLGDRVDPASYNAALSAPGQEPLLPGLLDGIRDADQAAAAFHVRTVDWGHPVFRSVADHIQLDAARISRFFTVEPDGASIVLAELEEGPLFLEKKVGAGAVILCTSSADMDWNNLPARPFYLPLLHQLVYHCGRTLKGRVSVLVGMPLTLGAPQPAAAEVRLYGPEGDLRAEAEPLTVWKGGTADRRRMVFEGTMRPGVYRAVTGAEGGERACLFAVNVDPRESNLNRIEPEEAARRLGASAVRVVADPSQLAALVRREREGLPLWDYLFAAAIIMAVVESFLGNVSLRH